MLSNPQLEFSLHQFVAKLTDLKILMISRDLYECYDEIIYTSDIVIIVAIFGLLKPFVVKYFCKIIRRHTGKLKIAKILHVHKT